MAKPTGFIEHGRQEPRHRPVAERVTDWFEVELLLSEDEIIRQASRCMDCGIPFCHGAGCPLANRIPEFNDLLYRGQWEQACRLLHATNNFPEITGRICPAPCEAACTLNLGGEPVVIRHIELQLAERGFEAGWIQPQPPQRQTGKRIAVIGSGPAGLAAAQQLARAGHEVVVFEKDDRVGGLLRYGIPDFKLDKRVLDRRLDQLRGEGVQFETSVTVGEDVSVRYLRNHFDAICLMMGAGKPRELAVAGRGLENVHFAMEFLRQANRLSAGDEVPIEERIDAHDKIVAVIGGGDTGSDCVGTARRQGAREIHLLEIMPAPPEAVDPLTTWPAWPRILRTTTSHEEGCRRRWSVKTTRLSGRGVRVASLHGIGVQWYQANDQWRMRDVPGSEFEMPVDLVLIAMGFEHVEHSPLVDSLGLKLDDRGNLAVNADGETSEPGIFAAGDAMTGASLVVRAIHSGRTVAASIDRWLASG